MAPAQHEWPDDDAREIWMLLLQPAFQMLREHISSHVTEHRLSPPQACLLRELSQPLSQREAARRLGYDPSNITALADGLQTRGLIERRVDPADRRIRTLARTAEGERANRELEESLAHPPAAIGRLSPEEQVVLLRLLRRIFSDRPG